MSSKNYWTFLQSRNLPAGFANAGQLAAQRHIAEADTADAELTHEGAGTATNRTAIVAARGELGLAGSLDFKGSTRHSLGSLLLERHTELFQKELAFLVGGGR